jgi:hypothetical protein
VAGRCRFSVSKPVLKALALVVAALETRISQTAFNVCFQFQFAVLQRGDCGDRDVVSAVPAKVVQIEPIKSMVKAPS